MKSNQRQVIIQSDGGSGSSKFSPTLVAMFALLLGGGFWWWQTNKTATAAQAEAGKLQGDENAVLASKFKSLLWNWLLHKTEIIELAKTVKDWGKVVDSYSTLYNGDSLEAKVRDALSTAEFAQFLLNLKIQGNPQNNTGTGTGTKAITPVGLVPKVSKLMVNNATANINLYTNWQDYPVKTAFSFAKGIALAPILFLEAIEFSYLSAGVGIKANLYKMQLANGKTYYIRAADFIKKAAVATPLKALGSFSSPEIDAA